MKIARCAPGSEEYLDSEKYQIRTWDLEGPDSLAELIAQINRIRRENLALHSDWSLRFHPADNDQIIVYSKMTDDLLNIIVAVVNLDPVARSPRGSICRSTCSISTRASLTRCTISSRMHAMCGGARGTRFELNPLRLPAHMFCIRRRVRTEDGVDYFV